MDIYKELSEIRSSITRLEKLVNDLQPKVFGPVKTYESAPYYLNPDFKLPVSCDSTGGNSNLYKPTTVCKDKK